MATKQRISLVMVIGFGFLSVIYYLIYFIGYRSTLRDTIHTELTNNDIHLASPKYKLQNNSKLITEKRPSELSYLKRPFAHLNLDEPQPITNDIKSKQSPTRNSVSNVNIASNKRPYYPALVLQGPPKCGTRTFVNTLSRYSDVVQYGPERSFWAGPNAWRCMVRYNKSEWMIYLQKYKLHQIKLYQLVIAIVTEKQSNRYCYPERYRWHWNKIKNYVTGGIGSNWINKSCQHPNETITVNSTYKRYCYLIEKGPVYTRTPRVGMIYAYLMPKIKLLTIVRDPLKQMISAIFAFPEPGVDKYNMNVTYRWLITHLKNDESFMNFTAMCTNLNTKWNKLKLDGKSGKERYLMMREEYRSYLVIYFWRRYVEPKFLLDPRSGIYKWSSFLFPTLMSTLFTWDESMGIDFMNNKWDPLSDNEYYENRYIEFEWMFDNMPDAMKLVKCWMMDLKTDIECNMEIHDMNNNQLFTNIERKNAFRSNRTKRENVYYQSQMQPLCNPCNMAFQHIVRYDRPKLMLGGWYDWNWKFV